MGLNVLTVEANSDVKIVPDEYFSIQEAINQSQSGDTIFVKSGIYFENIVVNKDGLRLIGEDMNTTIIDGGGTGIITYVEANNTKLSNFTMQNSGNRLTDSGIYLNHSFNNFISNNEVRTNNLGIYLFSSPDCILRDNIITKNQYNFGVSGSNIQDYIHDIDASNIVDGKPIIYWLNETNNHPPSDAGYVAIVNSTKVTVEDVTLTKNWQAVLFAYTTASTIKNVTVTSNMDAIWLIECTDCSIYNNTVSKNNWGGIALVNSHLCSVEGNDLIKNKEYGIFLSYSSNNIFYHNNFEYNKRQAWLFGFNNNTWDAGNLIGGNYWSDYNGTDEKSGFNQNDDGSDNIGDTPYIIDSYNKDGYPLMQPWIIPSPEAVPTNIWLYIITGLGIVVIVFIIVATLLKHQQRLASKSEIRRSAVKKEGRT